MKMRLLLRDAIQIHETFRNRYLKNATRGSERLVLVHQSTQGHVTEGFVENIEEINVLLPTKMTATCLYLLCVLLSEMEAMVSSLRASCSGSCVAALLRGGGANGELARSLNALDAAR